MLEENPKMAMKAKMRALLLAGAVLAASAPVAPCLAQSVQEETPSAQEAELYLTLPFCLDSAIAGRLDIRAAELSDAVENERRTGICLAEVSGLRPAARASSMTELDRIDAYLEFALAVSAPAAESAQILRHIAARRLAAEIAVLYFKAASIQKALEDSAGMLSKEESDGLQKRYDDARLELVKAICFNPVTDIKLDSACLEEAGAKRQTPEEFQELRELTVTAEDGQTAVIKLSDEFKSQLGVALAPGLLGAKRLWMVAGCKAAKTLLDPNAPPAGRPLYTAFAKLARERLAKARLRDTQEALDKLDIELCLEATKPPTPSLGSLIVRRDLALGDHCAANDAANDLDGALTLLKFAAPGLPEPKAEPADPALVEIPNPPQ